MGNLAGATKKMFGERTAAYKILGAVEKAVHIAKVAMTIKEMFFDTAATGAAVANSGTRSAASIVEAGIAGVKAVVEAITGPFPMNVIAGTATAAVIGTLLSSIGGSGPSVSGGASLPSGVTAEERQKTQGTGTVFGDSDAKSESIAKSLEILSDGEPEQVLANRTQIKLLESINDGIEKVATAVYQVKGITSGSGFGTTEGSSGGGLLGAIFGSSSTSIIDSGIKLAGTFNSLRKSGGGLIQQYETVSRTSGGGLFGLMGKSTSVSEQFKDIDPKVTATIRGVFDNMGKFFEEQGKSLGKTFTEVNAVLDTVDVNVFASLKGLKGKELQEELSAIFSQISDDAATKLYPSLVQFRKFGEGMAETVTRVTSGLTTVRNALISIGDTFKQLDEGVSTVDQSMLDQLATDKATKSAAEAALAANPTIQQFYDVESGQGYNTVPNQELIDKVTAATAKYQDSLEKVSTAQSTATANNVAASERLIAAFGTESKFLSAVNYFRDNFMTAGERLEIDTKRVTGGISKLLEPVISTVTDDSSGETITTRTENDSELTSTMKKAGVTSLKTAEDFKKVILAIDKTTPAGAELYASLSALQEGFVSVYGAVKDTTKALLKGQELEDAIAEQRLKITNLIGTAEQKLAAIRKKEFDELDPQLKDRQLYIYALEDEANLKAKLTTAYEKEKTAITSTIDALKNSIKTLTDYRQSLMTGAESPLTPLQKYEQQRAEVDRLKQIAQGPATTTAEIAARNDAINKLPAATGAFLASSKVLFASSAQYLDDFNNVVNIIDTTTALLTEQKTAAEQQLEALNTSVSFLTAIDANTLTTAQILAQYLAAQTATEAARIKSGEPVPTIIPAKAAGGMAQGLTIVGEEGPELVNFTAPGRVFSNSASNDLFNNRELVAEIKMLRQELLNLRKEQHEQTGHIITTNYDANNRAAEAVAAATEDIAKQQQWLARSVVKIA